jgi:thiamine biosynthesis lipoprotein
MVLFILKSKNSLPGSLTRPFWLNFILLFLLPLGCMNTQQVEPLPYFKVIGKTMGTTYSVQYGDMENRNFKKSIDSLLIAINNEVSVYEKEATISQFNRAKDTFDLAFGMKEFSGELTEKNLHFFKNYLMAKVIYQRTNGFFEPTILPLVNYWGFGNKGKKPVKKIDIPKIAELMLAVGFEKIEMINEGLDSNLKLLKQNPNTQLDFGGLAKGYAVDEIGRFLEKHGIKNYLAEIGGETVARGINSKDQTWAIGINTPKSDAAFDEFEEVVMLDNKAIATSGNYRQFYEIEGEKYSHIINPKTGYSEKSDLLSVSVIANDCMSADGYATAFFVLGKEKGLEIAQQLEDLEALFIYGKEDGSMGILMTDLFSEMLRKN